MSDRLEALEAAEAEATRKIEEAQREAQRVRASIPDEKAALRKEVLKKLRGEKKKQEAEVRGRVEELKTQLGSQTGARLEELREQAGPIAKKALSLLEQRISS